MKKTEDAAHLTIAEAARFVGTYTGIEISPSTIKRWYIEGRKKNGERRLLPKRQLGDLAPVSISREELKRFLDWLSQ